MSLEPVTTSLLIGHVIVSVLWVGTLFVLRLSIRMGSVGGFEGLRDFLGDSYRRLLLSSVVLGAATLMLGIVLAEVLLGFESALDFENPRIWPLHLGGALGLGSVMTLIMGIYPSVNDMLSLLQKPNAERYSQVETKRKLKSLAWRVRVMSTASVGLTLASVALMALSRSVS